MRLINPTKLSDLQKSTDKIRNICILAHVDHGKTTLADSLVASNGIISSKMIGKLRYLDSRKDEQERGITMKSSSIALYYSTSPEKEFLINLIDSPGHVDFSSEVSTAVRLCDGAIVVVDVVEGVCPQTCVALKQAWLDNVRPVLVLNKIDRLITELKLTPLDAYIHLRQVLEQVNAVTGALFNTEVLNRDATSTGESELTNSGDQNGVYDWSAGFEEEDDSSLYFAPETGNVIFASALDCWGFGIKEFAHFFSQKLGCKEELLRKVLWGDFYLNTKSKRVMKGAQEKAKKPVFVQLVLDNLWALYETVVIRKERDKVSSIVEKLGLKLTPRDLQLTDCKMQLQAITSKWLPLAKAVLDMVCEKLPSPSEIVAEKVEKLMCIKTRSFESLPAETQKLKDDFLACSSNEEAPVIVYISKMFPVERKSLPQNRIRPLTSEELAQRRERARARYAELRRNVNASADAGQTLEPDTESIVSDEKAPEQIESEDVFIAFARIFSGKLRKNQTLYVLGPKHDPAIVLQKNETINSSLTLKDLQSGQHITKVTINDLYLLMGRELESLEEVPAGNVVGIGGLDEHVLKTATLSTTVACPAFTELQIMAEPIVRVAVEPVRPMDMPQLIKGLKLLNQADACVQVLLQETGEHVLVTAGEVHLERCLSDLRERYAKIELNASEPIVPFRETVVPPPVVDMVNEAIQEHNVKKKDDSNAGLVTVWTANKQICIKIRAVPLPEEITTILEDNKDLLEAVDHFNLQTKQFKSSELGEQLAELTIGSSTTNNGNCSDNDASALTERTLKAMHDLKKKLNTTFDLSGEEWKNAAEQMWSVGPHKCGPNVLLNRVNNYNRSSIWTSRAMISDPRTEFDSSLVNGFQLATLAGPLCEEPMRGVCFIIEDWTLDLSIGDTGVYGPLSGQVMSAAKEGCRKAFQARPQRLMAAMYSCNITVNAEVLGKMYAVLGRRHGRVLGGDMTQGSASFTITAVLPVVESFSFAPEIRKQTSGLASPQLVFSHWETIDIDPFWTPSTEEEYLHFGEKSDTVNRARRYMDGVRKRKGLPVEEKIIEHAEKQRTLSKNK